MSRKAGLLNTTRPLSTLPAGSLLKLNETVGGVTTAVPFRVVAHGHHATGVTTLTRGATFASIIQWESGTIDANNPYLNSDVHEWLTATYYNYLDTAVKNLIPAVSLPCSYTGGGVGNYLVKVFSLSGTEIGFSDANMYVEGTHIPYFSDNAKRAQYDEYVQFWLRSYRKPEPATMAYQVHPDGTLMYQPIVNRARILPAFTLPSETVVTGTPDVDGCYFLV